jgi:hypothetical protein
MENIFQNYAEDDDIDKIDFTDDTNILQSIESEHNHFNATGKL